MVIITGIEEEDIVIGDYFNADGENDCGQKNLDKLPAYSNPCPTGNNFYVASTKSALVPMGCQDGNNQVFFSDPNLIASNIKQGVTLFGVVGTWNGQSYTPGSNISASGAVLTYNIPDGIYDGDETITITPSGVLPQFIKHGVTVFGITGTFYGTDNPSGASNVGYHTGVTLTAGGLTGGVGAPYGNTLITQQKVARVNGSDIFFLVSAYTTGGSSGYGYSMATVVKWNGTSFSQVWHYGLDGGFFYGAPFIFTNSILGSSYIAIQIRESPSSSYYQTYQLNMNTSSVSDTGLQTYSGGIINSTSVFYNGRYYEPTLTPSERITFTGSYNEIPNNTSGAYALNIKITV